MRISIAAKTTELCDRLTSCLGCISQDVHVEIWDGPAALLHRSDYSDWDIVIIEADDGMAAIELAERISTLSPHTGVVIIARDYRYAPEALAAHVQAYLTEPVSDEQIRGEYDYYLSRQSDFRTAGEGKSATEHTIEIREQNGFDCYMDGVPFRFSRSKSRDVMEYLISKQGSMVEDSELLEAVWGSENASAKSCLRTSKAEIVSLFRSAGCEDAIVKHRGRIGIMINKLA